jgi:hypothetical protein
VVGAANFQTCMTANQNQRRPFYLANPGVGQFYGNVDGFVTDGTQRYNGMLLSLARRATRGVTMSANYTLSHCLGSPDGFGGNTVNLGNGYNDPNNPHYDDGNCTADRRHVFTLTASAQTPEFSRAALKTVASGWRLSGSFRALSGPFLTVLTGSDRALNSQAGTQRVNVVLDNPFGDDSINAANGARRFLNPLAFSQPAFGVLGNMVRNSIEGIGSKNIDLALSRVFGLIGSQRLEVRAEAFNAMNWFQWQNPVAANLNLSSATFGQLTTAGDPRLLQFALKYTF